LKTTINVSVLHLTDVMTLHVICDVGKYWYNMFIIGTEIECTVILQSNIFLLFNNLKFRIHR